MFLSLIHAWVMEATGAEENLINPSPQQHSCPSWGIQWCTQTREDTKALQQVLVLAQGLVPVRHALKTPKGRCPGGKQIRCTKHLS